MKLSDRNKTVSEIVGLKKLSEILGWKIKNPVIKDQGANNELKDKAYCRGHNSALTSCDREIDREALAWALTKIIYHGNTEKKIDEFISTMPTWLKPTERK